MEKRGDTVECLGWEETVRGANHLPCHPPKQQVSCWPFKTVDFNRRNGALRRQRGGTLLQRALRGTAFGLLACSPLFGCSEPGADEPEYAGSSACVSCHQQQGSDWTGSHHDLAMAEADEGSVLGDFSDAQLIHGGDTTRFFSRSDSFFVSTQGPLGAAGEYHVAYTFGAYPLQQYLVGFPDGRFQALGTAWDARPAAEGGQRWFHLYGDEPIGPNDPLHWTSPNQTWNNTCAACHSTDLQRGYDETSDTYATTWAEIDVSCEACHGPGSNHVALAQSDPAALESGSATLVALPDPSRRWVLSPGDSTASRAQPLPSPSEVENCAACHSRRTDLTEAHDPTRPFWDQHQAALLRDGMYHPDGQIEDEVYVYGSFVQSKMYLAGVTCSDCHDPHSLELRAPGNGLCAGCHQPAVFETETHTLHQPGSPGNQCVACHMPETTYMVVDPRRDHSLRIPRPDLSATLGTPNPCTGCHTDQSNAWATQALAGRLPTEPHYGEVFARIRRGDPQADAELSEMAGDGTLSPIVRATALSLLRGRIAQGMEEGLATGLVDEHPMVRLGALGALEGQPPQTILQTALPLARDSMRSVRAEVGRLLSPIPPASFPSESRDLAQQAIAEYEATQWANRDHPSSWTNRANTHLAQGQLVEADSLLRTALRLDAGYVPAAVNLADLLRTVGRDTDGEAVLDAALASQPEHRALLHSKGLLLVRRGELDTAVSYLGRAAEGLDNPQYAFVHAVAVAATGDTTTAIAHLEAALDQHPWSPDLLSTLAIYHRDQGDLSEARRFATTLAEAYPGNQEAQALLTSLSPGDSP